jgi:hypothetical protein
MILRRKRIQHDAPDVLVALETLFLQGPEVIHRDKDSGAIGFNADAHGTDIIIIVWRDTDVGCIIRARARIWAGLRNSPIFVVVVVLVVVVGVRVTVTIRL